MGDGVTVGTWGGRSVPRVTASERGAATAEAAAVFPLLVALALGLVWLVSLTVTQVRVVDAARESARAAARGESDGTAIDRGSQVAPAGATFAVSRGGGSVSVRVVSQVRGPGGLFSFLPSVTVSSTAVAAEEPR